MFCHIIDFLIILSNNTILEFQYILKKSILFICNLILFILIDHKLIPLIVKIFEIKIILFLNYI